MMIGIEAWAPYVTGADYTDLKVFEGTCSLRAFIAGLLSYQPRWLVWLYRLRGVLARLLGLQKYDGPFEFPQLVPDAVSFVPGEEVWFFTVRSAEEGRFWLGETPRDKHLRAYFGIAVDRLAGERNRFHLITAVHYRHWTGPVYFNLIRPFHHLVVNRMAMAALRQ